MAIIGLILLIIAAMVAVVRYLQAVIFINKKSARLTAHAKDRKIDIDNKLRGMDLARQQSKKVGTKEAAQLLLDIEKTIPKLSFRFRLCGVFLFLSAVLVYFID